MALNRSCLAAALLLAAAAPLAADFQPVAEVDARGGYANTVHGSSAGLGLVDLNLVPAYKSGRLSLLPTISGSLGGQERSIQEGATFVRTGRLSFRPSLVSEREGGGSWTLRGQAMRSWNIESLGETWGTGFYDYEQFGAGAGAQLPSDMMGFKISLGADYAHRGYPNYHNIASAAALSGGKNYYTKDFHAVSGELSAGWELAGLRLGYRPEWRSYTDSYVTLKDGTTDLNTLQQDLLHLVEAGFSLGDPDALALNVGLDLSLNDSNHAGFDFAANKFVPDDQDYTSQTLSLALPWKAALLWDGLRLAPGAELVLKQTQKPIQDPSGAYTQGKQEDRESALRLDVDQALPWGLRWVASASHRWVSSNQEYVRGGLNTYEHFQVSTGFKLSFEAAPAAGPAAEPEEALADEEFNQDVADEWEGELSESSLAAISQAKAEEAAASASALTTAAAALPSAGLAAAAGSALAAAAAAPAAPAPAAAKAAGPEPTPEVRSHLDCAAITAQGAAAPAPERAACALAAVAGESQVSAERDASGGVIVRFLSGALRFEKGTDNLRAEDRTLLRKLAPALLAHPGVKIEVHGHSDNLGAAADNRWLSRSRAQIVAKVLGGAGVPAGSIPQAKGFGPEKPLASNETEAGRETNRRVELLLKD